MIMLGNLLNYKKIPMGYKPQFHGKVKNYRFLVDYITILKIIGHFKIKFIQIVNVAK